jgi:hypothetical protein
MRRACPRATNQLNYHPRRNREIGSLERRTNVPVAQRERAEENRAYVRRLLWEREPEFAAALAAVERSFSCPPCPDEDIAAGRGAVHESAEDMFAHLDHLGSADE